MTIEAGHIHTVMKKGLMLLGWTDIHPHFIPNSIDETESD